MGCGRGRGSQRDVVNQDWPIASLYMSPNAGGGGEFRILSFGVKLYTGAQINFGILTPYLTYRQTHTHTHTTTLSNGDENS
jgi:hypothetical protein